MQQTNTNKMSSLQQKLRIRLHEMRKHSDDDRRNSQGRICYFFGKFYANWQYRNRSKVTNFGNQTTKSNKMPDKMTNSFTPWSPSTRIVPSATILWFRTIKTVQNPHPSSPKIVSFLMNVGRNGFETLEIPSTSQPEKFLIDLKNFLKILNLLKINLH